MSWIDPNTVCEVCCEFAVCRLCEAIKRGANGALWLGLELRTKEITREAFDISKKKWISLTVLVLGSSHTTLSTGTCQGISVCPIHDLLTVWVGLWWSFIIMNNDFISARLYVVINQDSSMWLGLASTQQQVHIWFMTMEHFLLRSLLHGANESLWRGKAVFPVWDLQCVENYGTKSPWSGWEASHADVFITECCNEAVMNLISSKARRKCETWGMACTHVSLPLASAALSQ